MGQPLDDLLTLAERTYVRMQAGELLGHCLEQGDIKPFQELVEQLVLAGSVSLPVLREIHEEILALQSTLRQEGLAVRHDLRQALAGFGLNMPQLLGRDFPEMLWEVRSQRLRSRIREAARGLSGEDLRLVDQVCSEAGDRAVRIATRLGVLGSLEAAVEDWLGSLAYQAARLESRSTPAPGPKRPQ